MSYTPGIITNYYWTFGIVANFIRLILKQGDEYIKVCCTILLFFNMLIFYVYIIFIYKDVNVD